MNVGLAGRLVRHRGALVGLVDPRRAGADGPGRALAEPARPHQDGAAHRAATAGGDVLAGSDQLGRDVASRVLHGARISLTVGLIAVSIAVALGTPIGLVSGFYGGRLDALIMRVIDVLLAFPGILLALAIVSVLTPGLNNVMIAVGLSAVPTYARLVRASVLSARENLYVEAARALGSRDPSILTRYILPNVVAPLSSRHVGLGTAILAAAALSFLGLGSQPPQPEWGRMLSEDATTCARRGGSPPSRGSASCSRCSA